MGPNSVDHAHHIGALVQLLFTSNGRFHCELDARLHFRTSSAQKYAGPFYSALLRMLPHQMKLDRTINLD